MKLTVHAATHRGMKRAGNEDALLVREDLGLFAVCDGMGGHAAGDVASTKAVELVAEAIAERASEVENAASTPDGFYKLGGLVDEVIQNACAELHRLAQSSSELAGMGTTMTLVLVRGDRAIVGHVGDCRLYLHREGEIHRLSVDHTMAEEMLRSGSLDADQIAGSRFSHVLTRAIGYQPAVEVDTLLFDFLPGDAGLLCSDGLSRYFRDEDEIAALLGGEEPADLPEKLVALANRRGGADNVSAIVFRAESSEVDGDGSARSELLALDRTLLFRGLSLARRQRVLSACRSLQLEPGEILLDEDQACRCLYVLVEGHLEEDPAPDGATQSAACSPGDTLGALSLIRTQRARASLRAMSPSRLLALDRPAFDRLVKLRPRLGNRLLRRLTKVAARDRERVELIQGK